MSVPGGLDGQGLPLGLHLIGRELDEQGVLNAGLAIEERAGFTASSRRSGGERLSHQGRNRAIGRSWSASRSMRRSSPRPSCSPAPPPRSAPSPNTQVSLVDAAMPGMLPVPNRECIRQAVRTGMALDAVINRWSRFDRKNYFYADLPQGYQISQLYHPLVGPGEVEILLDEKDENSAKQIGIERIHVEQDAGKLMHDQHPTIVLCRPQPLRASR